MCIYSMFLTKDQRRNARVGETLTLGIHRNHRVFRGNDGEVTCIKDKAPVVITIELNDREMYTTMSDGFRKRFFEPHVPQPDSSGSQVFIPLSKLRQWHGKQVKATFIRWTSHNTEYSADALQLEDGTTIHMCWLAIGTTMVIPRKVRKDKGSRKPRNLVKVLGLDQIKADVPLEVCDASS